MKEAEEISKEEAALIKSAEYNGDEFAIPFWFRWISVVVYLIGLLASLAIFVWLISKQGSGQGFGLVIYFINGCIMFVLFPFWIVANIVKYKKFLGALTPEQKQAFYEIQKSKLVRIKILVFFASVGTILFVSILLIILQLFFT